MFSQVASYISVSDPFVLGGLRSFRLSRKYLSAGGVHRATEPSDAGTDAHAVVGIFLTNSCSPISNAQTCCLHSRNYPLRHSRCSVFSGAIDPLLAGSLHSQRSNMSPKFVVFSIMHLLLPGPSPDRYFGLPP